MDQKIITQEGYNKLKAELKELKEYKLPDIIDKIEKAKELGDLSENAEYHDAKDQQGLMVARIKEIENLLKSSVISQETSDRGEINMGMSFVVEDTKGVKKEFTIVSFNEADPISGKISNESPMGEAFMHKKVGDIVEVEIPKGVITYKVLEIK
jgi:transcription elongation factor GreA